MRAAPGAVVVEIGNCERLARALPTTPDAELLDRRFAHASLPSRLEAHAAELVVNARDVRRLPIEMRAPAAAQKLLLSVEHVRRHLAGRDVASDGFEVSAAFHAALEEAREGIEAAALDHLPELLAEKIRLDEHELRSLGVAEAAAIPREDDPAISASGLEEAASGKVRPVEDVEAEEAQPAGEAPEHLVGDEARFDIFHGALAVPTRTRFAPARTVK